MLSPLTNQQSHADGTLSDDEHRWLTMRALGGFGLTMTCAASVQEIGRGFTGQLGCHSDRHLPGLTRLACDVKMAGSVAIVQLHHAGNRSPKELIGAAPVCPSDDPETGARALTTAEVEQVIEDFVAAAARCEQAGFDGVELHGAHGYLLCQFLSGELNQRTDRFGGSLENRARPLLDIVRGIRATCAPDFHVGVRLSPERFGMKLDEIVRLYGWLVESNDVDMIDMSLWDYAKSPAETTTTGNEASGRRLVDVFAGLERGRTRLAVAGKIYSAADVNEVLRSGVDVVAIGRAAITNHDFPRRMQEAPDFAMRELPVTAETLRAEGLSDPFIGYMRNWKGFVAD